MEQILLWVDYFGIVVFAITGCLVAAKKQLDIVSFILLGIVTAIGGGTLRDMILDRAPVFWVAEPIYLTICAGTSVIMFFIAQRMETYSRWLIWGDAVGIAVFTVTGTNIAIEMGAPAAVCVLMGVMTSIIGGIIRDMLSNEPTLIMRQEVYASACAAGAVVYYVLYHHYLPAALPAGIATTFIIRAAAIHWRLHLPGYLWVDEVPSDDHNRRKGD